MPKSKSHLIILSIILSLGIISLKHRYGSVRSAFNTRNDFTVLVVGDVMLGRSVNANIQASHDATWPFHNISDLTKAADLTIGNLESPLMSNCPITRDGMRLCGEASNALGLKAAGFDFLSFANNHNTNYGTSGITDTIDSLSTYGITPILDQNVVYTTLGPSTLAILAFDDVSCSLDLPSLTKIIQTARLEADLVYAYFHWGNEYQTTSNTRQRELAHASIDAGADVILGAHPHVIQESESYQGKPIYYSLGNFVFDQEWSQATKQGLALRLSYHDQTLTKIEELPITIQNYGQPMLD